MFLFQFKENRMYLKALHICSALFVGLIVIAVVSHNDLTGQSASPKALPKQSQLPSGIDPVTLKARVDLVNILCSVLDKNTNAFVTNLSRNDFGIYEDNKKQQIQNFARETNIPLTIAMLIDTSDSVAPKLKFEQQAATNFFHSVLQKNDRAMLLEFDSGVTLLQDFTGDPNKLATQIAKMRAAGGTALFDAIYTACDEKLIRENGRKAIIILSDGEDRSSNTSLREAMEMALRAEATIFAISVSRGGLFGVSENTHEGDTILKEMARETGGKAFFPFKVADLEDAFRQISQELRSQYSLGYISTNTQLDGKYRKLEIKVQDKGLKLNYRKGYYAPKG
jgi:Ca-activated chloride channel homolog